MTETINTKEPEKSKNRISEVLYGWLFIADFYTQTRYAVNTEDYVAFSNGLKTKYTVYKSKTMSLDELAEYVKLKEG